MGDFAAKPTALWIHAPLTLGRRGACWLGTQIGCWYIRYQTRRTLERLPDRLLIDAGIERSAIGLAVEKAVQHYVEQRRQEGD